MPGGKRALKCTALYYTISVKIIVFHGNCSTKITFIYTYKSSLKQG